MRRTVETTTIDGVIRSQKIRWNAPLQSAPFHRCLLMVANEYDQGQLWRTEVIKYRVADGFPETKTVYGPVSKNAPREVWEKAAFVSPLKMLDSIKIPADMRAKLPYMS
jgi:hypothetical protein